MGTLPPEEREESLSITLDLPTEPGEGTGAEGDTSEQATSEQATSVLPMASLSALPEAQASGNAGQVSPPQAAVGSQEPSVSRTQPSVQSAARAAVQTGPALLLSASAEQEVAGGERIGRYVVLKTLGQGGMGVVYAAYDPELDRKVAIKLLRPDGNSADTSGGRERLVREAKAMAQVEHPHVCHVYDVGPYGEQIFVAMQFIEGPTLQQWLLEKHTWREVLQVFIQAGQGLAAAHEAGMVHRDFKPTNVLVDEGGRAYVTDFGLARAVAAGPESQEQSVVVPAVRLRAARTLSQTTLASVVTQQGMVMGTPHYMPPEQYLGHTLDARSDQFSFCAALYFALYKRRPFAPERVVDAAAELSGNTSRKVQARPATQDIIEEPPKDSEVPAWVRRAVLRGLALRPEQRFPSMEELLEELSQEPRRVRQRWALAAAGVVLLAAVGLGVQLRRQSQVCAGSEQLLEPVWNAQVQQRLQGAFAATGSPFAADAAQRVSQLLAGYAGDWVRQHTEACVATRVQGVQPEAIHSLRVVCLERRRKDLEALTRLLTEGVDGKLVERAVDAAHALPALRECQDIQSLAEQVPLPSDPALRRQIEQLGLKVSEVKALSDMGRYGPALELARQVEPQVRATSYTPLQADLHYHRGWLQCRMGQGEEGAAQLELAVRQAERGHADRTKMMALSQLLFCHGTQGRQEQALLWAGLAEATLDRLGGDALLEAVLRSVQGSVAMRAGRLQEAMDGFEKAYELHKRAAQPGDPGLARLVFNLGQAALQLGQTHRAVVLLEEALQQTLAAKGNTHPDVANRHVILSWAYREEHQHEQALRHAREAVRIRQAVFGEQHALVAEAVDAEGMSLISLGRYEEARQTFEKSVAMKERALGPDSGDLAYSYDGIGRALLEQGRPKEAVAPLEKALRFDFEESVRAEIEFNLARALWGAGQQQRALDMARQARERLARLGTQGGITQRVDEWLQSTRQQVRQ